MRSVLPLLVLFLLLAPARAFGRAIVPPPEAPLEILVTEADLIVTATVTALPHPPGTTPRAAPNPADFETAFKVEKTHIKQITVTLDGKELRANIFNVTRGTRLVPKIGDKVLLAVRQSNDGQYIPLGYCNAFTVDPDASLKALAPLLDVDKWNWGKETNGLRVVSVLKDVRVDPATDAASISLMMGVRNVSGDVIYLNTYDPDLPLSAKAFADGTAIPVTQAGAGSPSTFGEGHLRPIPPGRVCWLNTYGAAYRPFTVKIPGPSVQLRQRYTSTRDAKSQTGQPAWKGAMDAADITVKIPLPRRR